MTNTVVGNFEGSMQAHDVASAKKPSGPEQGLLREELDTTMQWSAESRDIMSATTIGVRATRERLERDAVCHAERACGYSERSPVTVLVIFRERTTYAPSGGRP